MKIFILGDFMLGRYIYPILNRKELKKYLEKVSFKWKDEIAIANLETPLIKGHFTPQKKINPLGVNENIVKQISKTNISAFSLANNHICDFGSDGLQNTIYQLEKNKIGFFGAGKNLELASKPFIFKKNNLSVGFLAFSYANIAAKDKAGTADLYSPIIFNQVKELKSYVDYVIVINHTGIELLKYPLPRDQKIFRKIVDFGADLVVGSHSHCIQTMENYIGKKIYYGIGDLVYDSFSERTWKKYWIGDAHPKLFNIPSSKEQTKYSLIIEINCHKNDIDVRHHPVYSGGKIGPSFLKGKDLSKWNEKFQNDCNYIKLDKMNKDNLLNIERAVLSKINKQC